MADRELVRLLVADVDCVYHLAAAVGVQLIARDPVRTIETNIYPTELILAELKARHDRGERVKLFLASTSEVYGKNPGRAGPKRTTWFSAPRPKPAGRTACRKRSTNFWLAYSREHGLPLVMAVFQCRGATAKRGVRHGLAATGRRGLGRRTIGGA